MRMRGRPVTILIVQGHLDDHRRTDERFRLRRLANEIRFVEGSLEALDYLNRRNEYGDSGSAPAPGLIVIDIDDAAANVLLTALAADAELHRIPTIVLTDRDVTGQIDLTVDASLVTRVRRPASLQHITTAMASFQSFRFEVQMVHHNGWFETELWIRQNYGDTLVDLGKAESVLERRVAVFEEGSNRL